MNGAEDALFHLGSVWSGQAVVGHGVGRLIAALFQNARRGNVGHHVIRIAGDDDALGAVLFLDAENVIDHHLAAERHQGQVPAKTDRLDRIRIAANRMTLIVGLEHHFRVPDPKNVGILKP